MTAPDYTAALETAVAAARAAGALLRREFERDGGPRGPLGKCPADNEAEAVIRDRLLAAHRWPLYGEELGVGQPPAGDAPRDPSHYWLVDPNDGTAAMQQGFRGAAVSIALVRGQEPVLGVVLAYAPPLGSGAGVDEDLIVWAEGMPVPTRNGQPAPVQWPDELTVDHTVLVSQDADHNASANLAVVAPARFRPLPSPAYRLALAAVGEGLAVAAVSLGNCSDYDVAAAHAILRGAGGVLLTAEGTPFRHSGSPHQRTGSRRFVGGAPEIARALSRADWSTVFERDRDRVSLMPGKRRRTLLRPDATRIAGADVPLDRGRGLLLGQLIGDALGAQIEFKTARHLAERYPDGLRTIRDGGTWHTLGGQPTDDSELALALARSLAETGTYDASDALAAYVDWFGTAPFDVGNTIGSALAAAGAGSGADELAARGTGSQANGAMMRISPLALVGWARPDDVVLAWARTDAALTHPHPVCGVANVAYVAGLLTALRGGTPDAALAAARAAVATLSSRESPLASAVAVVDERLARAPEEAPPALDGKSQGWVLHALENAFHELLDATSLEEGLVRTVMRGGDTDTNGAIAGALLGAHFGAASMPRHLVDRVLTCRPLPGTATRHSRPRRFWPVDVLVLAERLLTTPH